MVRCAVLLARRLVSFAVVAALVAPVAAQDPPVAAPPTQVPSLLRLREAIEIALQSSNFIGVEQANLYAARKERTNAWWNLGPDLRVSGVYGESERNTLGGELIEKSTFRSGEASTSIRLFDGLSNVMRIKATGKDVTAQEHSLEYTRAQAIEIVTETYFNLLRAKLLLNVAQESEKVSREQLERSQALYELGSAARSDVLRQQVQHDNTRLDLVKAEQLERQAYVDLVWAMNLESTTPFDIDTTLASLPFKPTVYEAERDYALVHRQNLLSFRAQEAAAGHRVWEARGLLWPTVDFNYSFDQTRNTSQFSFDSENRTGSWNFFANWNLWDRYNKYATIGRAKANNRIASYQRRQAELDAIREVRRLVNTMDEAHERLAVSRQNVESAREDLRLAQEKFRVGAGTSLDTTTAESDLTRARANEVQAIVDYLIARAQLARATGKSLSEV